MHRNIENLIHMREKKYLGETDSQEKPNVGFSKDFKVHIINSILGKYDPNELIDQSLQRKGG